MFNKIPYLNRLFMNTAISFDSYIWDDNLLMSTNTVAAVSTEGNWLLVGKRGGGEISLFNLTDPKDHVVGIVPSRNDGMFKNVKTGEDSSVSFDTDGVVSDITLGSRADWLRFTPDATAFLVHRVCREKNGTETESMELFDRATGHLLRTIPVEPHFRTGDISPDGRMLVAAGPSSLEYWDLRSAQKTASAPLYGVNDVNELRFSPDGRFIFLAPQKGNVRVYDARSLIEVASIPANQSPVRIAVSPDARILCILNSQELFITASWNVRLYEIGTWRLLREIVAGDMDKYYTFHNVRFAKNGNRLFALGMCRKEAEGKKPQTMLCSGLFELDLSAEKSDWTDVDYKTLPLHPEGKFLLDGRDDSAQYFSTFFETMGVDFNMKIRVNK